MKIIKVIEVISTSDKGFTEAVQRAVEEVSKTVKNIKSVYIKDMNVKVDNNRIVSYGITAKVSFEVEDK